MTDSDIHICVTNCTDTCHYRCAINLRVGIFIQNNLFGNRSVMQFFRTCNLASSSIDNADKCRSVIGLYGIKGKIYAVRIAYTSDLMYISCGGWNNNIARKIFYYEIKVLPEDRIANYTYGWQTWRVDVLKAVSGYFLGK